MRRLVFVDLDGTLLAGASEPRFIGHLLATRRIGPGACLRALSFALRHGARFGRHVWKKNKAYLAGFTTADLERWGRDFATERLIPSLRPQICARLASHRAAGDRIVLMTGTPDFLAAPIAASIGAASWIATTCAREGERYLAAPPPRHPFAAEKLALASEAASRLGVAIGDCVAYADTAADIDLLAAVGTPVAVNPDRGLARHARRHGWEIIACDSRRPFRRIAARAGQRA